MRYGPSTSTPRRRLGRRRLRSRVATTSPYRQTEGRAEPRVRAGALLGAHIDRRQAQDLSRYPAADTTCPPGKIRQFEGSRRSTCTDVRLHRASHLHRDDARDGPRGSSAASRSTRCQASSSYSTDATSQNSWPSCGRCWPRATGRSPSGHQPHDPKLDAHPESASLKSATPSQPKRAVIEVDGERRCRPRRSSDRPDGTESRR